MVTSILLSCLVRCTEVSLRLPDVEQELAASLQNVNRRLKELPASKFDDPSSELVGLIFEFTANVSRNVKGIRQYEDATPGLMPGIRAAQRDLRSSVLLTAPKFCPWARQDTPHGSPNSVLSSVQIEQAICPPAWVAEPFFLAEEERAPFDSRMGRVLFLDEIMERAEQCVISFCCPVAS